MKKSVLAASLVLMIGSATAITNFQEESTVKSQLVGGETTNFSASFENDDTNSLPLYIRLNSSSDTKIEGPEFDIEAHLDSVNGSESKRSILECKSLKGPNYKYRPEKKNMIYSCFDKNGDRNILANSENSLNVSLELHEAIAPAEFSFELEVLSYVGETADKIEVQDEKSRDIQTGRTTVSFESKEEVDVAVWRFSKLYREHPDERELVDAVDVMASPSDQQQCPGSVTEIVSPVFDYVNEEDYWFDRLKCVKPSEEVSGQISFNYSGYNPSKTDIYRLDGNGWKKVDDSYTSGGEIKANVSEFSVYAAFGQRLGESPGENLDFSNVLPGDKGLKAVEFEVAEPSKVYLGANETEDKDNTCNEPELKAEPNCAPDADGELDDWMNLSAYVDDGDGVYSGEFVVGDATNGSYVIEDDGSQKVFEPGKYTAVYNWSFDYNAGNKVQTDSLEYKLFVKTEPTGEEEDGGKNEVSEQNSNEDETSGSSDEVNGGSVTTSVIDQTGGVDDSEGSDSGGGIDPEFAYNQSEGTLDVEFNATETTSESGIDSYDWEFGDGETGSGETVSHQYSDAGQYVVALNVTSDGETERETEIVQVDPVVGENVEVQGAEGEDEQSLQSGEQTDEENGQSVTAQFVNQPAMFASLLVLSVIILGAALYLRKEIAVKIKSLAPF